MFRSPVYGCLYWEVLLLSRYTTRPAIYAAFVQLGARNYKYQMNTTPFEEIEM